MNLIKLITISLLVLLTFISKAFAGAYANNYIDVDLSLIPSGVDFENAILIEDKEDLIKLSQTSNDWNKFFKQTTNIVFESSSTQDWNGDEIDGLGDGGFSPIGNQTTPFSGSYDGAGYEIDSLYMYKSSDSLVAFFGYVDGNEEIDTVIIKNLSIGENSTIRSRSSEIYLSGLVAFSKGNLKIDSCYNSGSISYSLGSSVASTPFIGSLVGYSESTLIINNSGNDGEVSSSAARTTYIGGLVGRSWYITISDSYNNGYVYSSTTEGSAYKVPGANVGGFVGISDSAVIIDNSYNSANIKFEAEDSYNDGSTNFVSGFLGRVNSSLKIDNSYNTGTVTIIAENSGTSAYSGAFVGLISSNLQINNSHNNGRIVTTIDGSARTGGFAGESKVTTISGSYNAGYIDVESYNESYVGGLVGKASKIIIENSYNDASVYSEMTYDSYTGGFVGYSTISMSLNSSYNAGSVNSKTNSTGAIIFIGGFTGKTFALEIDDCYNKGSVYAKSGDEFYAGGFVGYLPIGTTNPFSISNSYNLGKITTETSNTSTSARDFYTGGFVGYITCSVFSITNSYNKGDVLAASTTYSYVGGFVGKSISDLDVLNSYNSGRVLSNSSSGRNGGFVGEVSYKLDITNSYNSGGIVSFSNSVYSGGFVGFSGTELDILNSYSSGSVVSSTNGGGFSGGTLSTSIITITNSYFDYETTGQLSENAIGNNTGYTNHGIATETFKSEVKFADWFATTPNDSQPWVYNVEGRPYLYFQKFAVSNTKLLNASLDSIDIFVVDNDYSDTLNITQSGIRYCYYNETSKKNYCSFASILDTVVEIDLEQRTYQIQPYLKLTDNSYVYGDMVTYESTENNSKEISLTFTKLPEEITFVNLITEADLYVTPEYIILGTTTSGENIIYTSLNEAVCTIKFSKITFLSSGLCEVEAQVAESVNYEGSIKSFEIEVDNITLLLTNQKLNFTPHLVQAYNLSGQLIKSKFCYTLSDYRVMLNSLSKNQRYIVR